MEPKLIKLDIQKGYPMLLKFDKSTINFVHTGEVNIGDSLAIGYRVFKIDSIAEQREARGDHQVPATFYSCNVTIVQDLTPAPKAKVETPKTPAQNG